MSKIERLLQELCPDGVEYKKIGDLCNISRGVVISKQYIKEHGGVYPVYSSATFNNGEIGKIDSYDYDGEYVTWTTDGANAGSVFYRNERFNATNVCGLLRVMDTKILQTKYLYYALGIVIKDYVNTNIANAKLMSNVVEGIEIPVPHLQIQEEIVSVLDKFEELQKELQVELQLRKQQYASYRDKLLDFTKIKGGAAVNSYLYYFLRCSLTKCQVKVA